MTKQELNQLVTREDLNQFSEKLLGNISQLFALNKEGKKFYSPRQFSKKTGMKYTTIIDHLNKGKIKGRQDGPGCTWQIDAKELVRFGFESEENLLK